MASTFPTTGNQKWTYLAEALTAGETDVDVTSASALGVSGLTAPSYAYAVIVSADSAWKKPTVTPEVFEIVKITSVSSNTLTVARAQDNTTALAWDSGAVIRLSPVAANFTDIHNALTGGASGGDLAFDDLDIHGEFGMGTGGVMVDGTWSRFLNVQDSSLKPYTASSPCAAATEENYDTNDTNIWTMAFDPDTVENSTGVIMLPSWYDARAVKMRVLWTAASGSGSVVWAIRFVDLADDRTLSTNTSTSVNITDTLLAANDMHISPEGSLVPPNGATGINMLAVVVRRAATNGSDTLAVDAKLIGVHFYF